MDSKKQLWLKVLIFIAFLLTVNLLAGYIAIAFKYPSLWNASVKFEEYAIPFFGYWGMLHIPSMLIFGAPLLLLARHQTNYISYFRIFCVCVCLLLLLELDRKIPFLLFPKIDAFVAFFFSLLAFPPSKRENPKLVATLKWLLIAVVLVLGYFAYTFTQHQTPPITKSQYENGLFELKSIVVKNDFHQEMLFEVDMKARVPEEQACILAQPMAAGILHDYPFDDQYKKEIEVVFNPEPSDASFHSYTLGVISLNNKHKEKDGSFACYLKYKDD